MARRRQEDAQRRAEYIARRDELRHRRDRQQRQTLLAVILPILIGCAVFLGFGIYNELWRKPSTPVARVNDETITAGAFVPRIAYERYQLLNTLSSFASFASSSSPDFLTNFAQGQRDNLAQNTIDRMIDEALIRQEASRRDIAVSDEDVRNQLIDTDLASVLQPSPTPAPTGTAGAAGEGAEEAEGDSEPSGGEAAPETGAGSAAALGATGAITPSAALTGTGVLSAAAGVSGTLPLGDADEAGTVEDAAEATASPEAGGEPTPTPTPLHLSVNDEAYEKAFEDYIQPLLATTGVTRKQFYDIVRQRVFRERLNESLGATLPLTDKQVEIEYLLFQDQGVAQEAAQALEDGATWEEALERFGPRDPADVDAGAADAGALGATEAITDTAASDTAEGDAGTADAAEDASASETDAATDAVDGTAAVTETGAAGALVESDAITGTGTLTDTGTVTGTGAITGTGAVTETGAAPALPTAAPTPTPEPFAFEKGDPTWYTLDGLKDRLGIENPDKIMALGAGEVSDAVQTSRGHMVVVVVDRDDQRSLADDEMEQRRAGAVDAWLEEQRLAARIDRFPFTDKVPPEPEWFTLRYDQLMGSGVPTLDVSSLSVGTPTPAGDAGGG